MAKKLQERLRHRARRQGHLDSLYALQNSLCHWCGSACAIPRNIPPHLLIAAGASDVLWKDEHGRTYKAHVATIDHVNPISTHGEAAGVPDNYVMACSSCNRDRTATQSPTPHPIRRVCPKCYGPKDRKRSLCNPCRFSNTAAWLTSHGWQIVDSPDGQYKRLIDPITGVEHKLLSYACKIQRSRKAGQEKTHEDARTDREDAEGPGGL